MGNRNADGQDRPKSLCLFIWTKMQIILDARQEYIMLWEKSKLIKHQMIWSEVDLIVSFGISSNLQTIKWFRQRTFKSVFGKDTHPLRLRLILRCWGRSQGWNANVHLNAGSFWDFWSKVHISLTSWKNCKSCPSYEDQKVSVKRKSKVTIFLLRVSSHSRPFCPLSLIYYRTRVRSLAMLVTNSLTPI